ncbi:MAG: ABC transporter permease [Propioniciclava sp.]|uniref:ABC transporter permease n=1 Tax=Propioniciclava sp. TaxID=2038686 RepID=UPI0039E5EAD0
MSIAVTMRPRSVFRPNRAMRWGLGVVGFFLLVAAFAPLLAPHDPTVMGLPMQKPSREHLLGTNDVGQDIFSELIFGTRVSLLIGVFAAVTVTVVASSLALLAGYYRGVVDTLVTALTNVTMALPSLALTVLLVAYLNPGKWSIIIAISVTGWPATLRILRSRVLQLCELPFVKVEKSMGVASPVIMAKHLLPNISDIVLTRAALAVSSAMVTEAGLSFLGLGDGGEKSWGTMLHYAFFQNGVVRGYYWWYLPPIVCISVAVLGFMLVGYYGTQRTDAGIHA